MGAVEKRGREEREESEERRSEGRRGEERRGEESEGLVVWDEGRGEEGGDGVSEEDAAGQTTGLLARRIRVRGVFGPERIRRRKHPLESGGKKRS